MGFFQKIKDKRLKSYLETLNLEDSLKNEILTDIDSGKITKKSQIDALILPEEPKTDKPSASKKSEYQNFTLLNSLILKNSSETVLTSDIILNDSEVSTFKDGIKLTSDMTIDGGGHVIDACGKARIFNASGCKITFRNVTFKNGFIEKNDYHDRTEDGGAICCLEADLTFENCIFLENKCVGSASCAAGAVYNNGGSLSFRDCRFVSNHSSYHGGAIYNVTDKKLNIENTIFEDNSIETGLGGALYNSRGSGVISKSTFTKNSVADGDGAAIYNANELSSVKHELKVEDCTFEKNSAKATGSYFEGMGGAIYNKSIIYCENCTFKENYAFIGGAFCNDNSRANIVKSTFTDNSSKYSAVIYQYRDDANLTIESSNLSHALTDERLVYVEKGYCLVKGCEFKTDNFEKEGYAIYNNKASVTVEKSKFIDEHDKKTIFNNNVMKISDDIKQTVEQGYFAKPLESISSGSEKKEVSAEKKTESKVSKNSKGFSYLEDLIQSGSGEIVLDCDIEMREDERNFYEGGIELADSVTVDGNGHTINAGGLSRIFYITAGNVELKNIKFKNGAYVKSPFDTEHNGGGAIYALHKTSLKITDCEFFSNKSRQSAGAICTKGNSLSLKDTTFGNNESQGYGTLYCDNGTVDIKGCEFRNNKGSNGAAIYINDGHVKFVSCTFKYNSAAVEGGAVTVYDGEGELDGCSFINNSSNQGLGGGALSNRNGDLKIFSCHFKSNYGCYGGALFNGEGNIDMDSSNFEDNFPVAVFETSSYRSLGEGGCIYNKGFVKLFNTYFVGREPDVLSNKGTMEVDSCVFKRHHNIKNEGKIIEGSNLIS
ncbi:MAG: hypothetical protein IJL02_00480 [Methanobrevibacter sp.]|uniref:pectate lyase-like adhesive domain-containing protein n=1 Tax=Methanobrevibacter sp. TaxID=66852 RepID=UPI0025FFC690|nr:pectate lyase-like adhesive domain-containing protein [Methanobrevibacter sp.]MBQ6098322.1 hypothetical protein [Methanobrevibacter sp.]